MLLEKHFTHFVNISMCQQHNKQNVFNFLRLNIFVMLVDTKCVNVKIIVESYQKNYLSKISIAI